jgi:TolB-like protein/DNA-binding winged helix-turn-helix (wHTH) protein/Tfp pilus assembly protein PilF
MTKEPKQFYEFGPFRLDPEKLLLLRDNQPVALPPKAFETLLVLVRRSETLVLKDDLMKSVWPDTFVEESNLAQNIFVLRKSLGEATGANRYIVTVPGRGYRFTEKVRLVPEPEKISDEITVQSHSVTKVVIDEQSVPDLVLALPQPALLTGSHRFRLIAFLAGMIALAVAGYWDWHSQHKNLASSDRVMLAVLPFQNLTGDPEQEYFADGLTEEMITQLGRLSPDQLGVIARTSVMGYKHGDKRLDQIGRELSVQYVLEGSFRRAGDRLRITAQLIQVKDQTHLWAQDYDRRPEDILAVQDEVSIAVAEEIQLRLTPQQRTKFARARTVDPEAYEAYLKGLYFWNKRSEDGFRKAIECFNQSIAKDPNYAQAYAGLADAYVLLGSYGFMPQREAMPKAKAAAQKALAMDDQLAEAYTSLGLISEQWDWNWVEEEKDYKRAVELNPNYSVAHHWYGDTYLVLEGRIDDAIAELRKAHELDPLSSAVATDLAKRLSDAHGYDEAVALFQKTLDLDPDFVPARHYLAQAYEQMGRYSDAIAEVKKVKSWETLAYMLGQLGHIYALQGRRQEALEIANELQRRSAQRYTDPVYLPKIYAVLGENDAAMVWLEKAYQERSVGMLLLNHDPDYDHLRSDPRFQDLVRRVGLP